METLSQARTSVSKNLSAFKFMKNKNNHMFNEEKKATNQWMFV